MEYLLDRGTYADVPVQKIIATFRDSCPRVLEADSFRGGDFASEAGTGVR
jgi:hypothetical protein